MNGRDALKALADGKKVRRHDWKPGAYLRIDQFAQMSYSGGTSFHNGTYHRWDDNDWELVEEPATDEELVAWMEKASKQDVSILARQAYALCAKMLRTRKVLTP